MGAAHRWLMEGVGQPLVRHTFEPGPPAADEVVVEVAGCGVCHTDLGYLYDGVRTNQPLPLALGHEISGRVAAAGAGAERWLGAAVIVPAVIPCGTCDQCVRGLATICRQQKMPGNDIHGGFATHVSVPAHGLCAVDEARLDAAGLGLADVSVVADAVTTPYQAAVQAEIESGDLAIVIGVGGVGSYAVQVAAAMGATVVAVDVDPARLEKLSAYGAALTVDARNFRGRELKQAVASFASDRGLRQTEWKILECSGTAAGQTSAFGLLTHGATLAVVGFTMDRVELRLSNLMAFHARALGNWGCAPEHYPRALDLVLAGKVVMAPFIRRHPLGEVNRVLEAAHAHQLTERAILVP
jgi:6-hydroxycyclohex-1-ene-1-carbonyl-CoA dehydrogenase